MCDRVQILHRGSQVFNDSIAALRQFRGAALEVGLRRPPAHAELQAIPGIASVEQVAPGVLRIFPVESADPTEALVSRAVAGDWGLYQLMPAQTRLEDVFAQLTREAA